MTITNMLEWHPVDQSFAEPHWWTAEPLPGYEVDASTLNGIRWHSRVRFDRAHQSGDRTMEERFIQIHEGGPFGTMEEAKADAERMYARHRAKLAQRRESWEHHKAQRS